MDSEQRDESNGRCTNSVKVEGVEAQKIVDENCDEQIEQPAHERRETSPSAGKEVQLEITEPTLSSANQGEQTKYEVQHEFEEESTVQQNAIIESEEKKKGTTMLDVFEDEVNSATEQTEGKMTITGENSVKFTSSSTPESTLITTEQESPQQNSEIKKAISHLECIARQEEQRKHFEQQLEQLRAALSQKDNMIALFQRENGILEKEKQAFRKEKENANKEKESIVIKFAMKEKLLIDAKKEKEAVEKQLADAKKEIKNVSTKFQALNEEKSRITYMMDEKCNEVRKYQRECEKLKTDCGHLESKLKYHVNKLNIETEAKQVLEKKLEEEKNSPNKLEEKANEKLKMEYEANTILLKHELANKDKSIEALTKEQTKATERLKQLQEQVNKETAENARLATELETLRQEHESIQNAYSEEMLASAKLRGQLDELQLLKTQNTLYEDKIENFTKVTKDLEEKLQDNAQDLLHLHEREKELLSINKEMSESIVTFQNEICLLKAKAQGIEAENEILKREKSDFDAKYTSLEAKLDQEARQKSEERQLLTKHLSEKTKLYEVTKMKLENALGDLEATKNKQTQVVKELQREIQKYKKYLEQSSTNNQSQNTGSHSSPAKAFADMHRKLYCSQCQKALNNGSAVQAPSDHSNSSVDGSQVQHEENRNGSHSGHSSRRPSESSESETIASNVSASALTNDLQGPSKKHLVERILRLQQASARQTEKIDFLENHTLSLVAELQKKSKVVQYYMLRDQVGALTSSKSDQNKSELAKYGSGVMSAIYGGIKGANQTSMTLELSLEINKKLQAVLEDTLLKNITLKENLDVLGLEVDKLTRKLAQLEANE